MLTRLKWIYIGREVLSRTNMVLAKTTADVPSPSWVLLRLQPVGRGSEPEGECCE